MANYTINANEHIVEITDNDNTVSISFAMVQDISRDVDRQYYYREDVTNQIKILIESNDLPEDAINNIKYIDDVTDEYAKYREKYEGDSFGMSWTDCLNEAFDEIDYNDYVDED